MANSIADNLEAAWKKLPNAMNGNGQNFIFLLKELLGNLTEQLNAKFKEISKLSNSITNTPDTIDEQLKDCKIKEVRVGTAISLVLSWDYSNIKNYESAEIYVKEHEGNIASVIDWSAVDVSRTIRTTKTNTYTIDGINAGYVYQITFVGKNNLGSVSKKDSAPVLVYAVSALNNVPDPPLEFDVYFSRTGVLWKWKQPNNLDYSYSELRTNQDVGNKVGLLEVTQDTKSTVLPPTREGTAYLYNKGYGSKYSTPLDKEWSKPVPTAPQTFKAEKTFRGILFTYSKIPEDCIGIIISINGEKHYTQDDTWTYYCTMGNFVVKACYYDIFGEGTWTEESTVAVYTEIDPDWLKDESITLAKVDTTIKDAVKDAQDSVGKINTINGSIAQLEKTDASITSTVAENKKAQDTQNATFISQIKQNADSITSVVTSVGETNKKVDSNYSAILQNQKDIALRVKSDDIINQINISKEGVRIDGNKVHITGDTIFDKGVIVSSYIGDKQVVGTKIADGAIETDKLAANAVTAGKIATNAVTTDKIDAGAVTTDKIEAGAVTADTIGAGAITSDKLTAGAVTADKLAANEIKLAGALKVVGGLVTFDENGLSCGSSDGSKVVFNNSGMSFIDKNGNPYNIVNQTCIGVAKHNQHVKFSQEWPSTPSVSVFPMEIVTSNPVYSTSEVTFHCYATNITTSGFDMKCYAGIKNANGVVPVNSVLIDKKAGRKPGIPVDSEGDNGHTWTWENTWQTTAPLDGNSSINIFSTHKAGAGREDANGSFQIWMNSTYYVYVNGTLATSVSHDFGGIEFNIYYGENGHTTIKYTGDYEYNGNLNFYASRGQTIQVKEVHNGKITAGHGRGWYEHITTIKSITFSFTGEQAIDSNGVGGFIATIGNNNNYTVS